MTDQEYVLSQHPEANAFGPVKLYWPDAGERTAYIVTLHPVLSAAAGQGDSIEEAWTSAANNLRNLGKRE
jgi:hypothetical protein